MKWLNNLKTQTRLLLIFAVLTLVGALSTGWNLFNIVRLQQRIYQIQQESLALSDTAEVYGLFLEQQLASKSYLLTENPFYQTLYKRHDAQIEQHLRQALVSADSPDRREDISVLDEGREEFAEAVTAGAGALEAGDSEEAVRISDDQVYAEANRVQEHLGSMIHKRELELAALVEQTEDQIQATIVIGGIILTLFSVLVILPAVATNQVAEPMLRLTNAVVAFECDTFDPDLLKGYTRRRDEMGQLVRSFAAMANSITESMRERDRFLSAATRFVPNQYLDFLEKDSIVDVKLGDHVSAEMAIMFSDIRGFTTMSEGMTPQENFDFVNEYLEMVSPIIQKYDGFIVKFLGDGIMAIFPYGVDDAVRAGIEKQRRVKAFNARRQAQGLPPVDVGIGVHTGHMMVGMIGEINRIQGDAFSDNVNLTSRVEGLTKFYGVSMIISEETRMRLEQPERYKMRFLGKAVVQGRAHPISLYDVFEGEPEEIQERKLQTREDYERGLKLYMTGRFAEAQGCFEAVLDRNPHDRTAALYLDRSTTLMAQGVPEDWEGVEVMTSK
jgi:class 3 adenylate cyclase/CHASE3 domain sensor protein